MVQVSKAGAASPLPDPNTIKVESDSAALQLSPAPIPFEWNLAAMFSSHEAWELEFNRISDEHKQLSRFQGTLSESAQNLFLALEESSAILTSFGKLHQYKYLLYYGDTKNSEFKADHDRAVNLAASIRKSMAFIDPEILSLGTDTLDSYLKSFPQLNKYAFYLSELERGRPHILTAEMEELLAVFSPALRNPESLHTALNNGDFSSQRIWHNGRPTDVGQENIDPLLSSPTRSIREPAYYSYADYYTRHANTFAEILFQQVRTSGQFATARKYKSTLEKSLFSEDLSCEVMNSALSVCREFRPLMRRYFKAKAQILGVKKLSEFDIHAPLSSESIDIDYAQALDLVLNSLRPLGDEYTEIARRGLLVEGWADVFARTGKYNNPFSAGSYGTYPYLLLNFAPTMTEVGTLAHELGHSMHTYFTNRSQHRYYSNYSSMVAETASNLNQVLLREYVFKTAGTTTVLQMLDEAFYFINRYMCLFPAFAEIEHYLHTTYAEGGSLSLDALKDKTVQVFSDVYGDAVAFDPRIVSMKWAQYCHFYDPYYLYQYSVGISAAMAVGPQIVSGHTDIRDRYLNLLSLGSSLPTMNIFRSIGSDIASREPYRQAFALVERYVEKLEMIGRQTA